MPNVYHAEASLYTCSDTNQQHIKDMIRQRRDNLDTIRAKFDAEKARYIELTGGR